MWLKSWVLARKRECVLATYGQMRALPKNLRIKIWNWILFKMLSMSLFHDSSHLCVIVSHYYYSTYISN